MSSLYRGTLMGLTAAMLCTYPAAAEETVGCDDVNWTQQVLLQFEGIDQACQEVVIRKGNRFVRFEVEFERATANGDVYVLMKLQDGSRVERVFPAPRDFHVLSSTGKTDFNMHELVRGDILDVYIPMSFVVAATPTQ